MIPQTKIDEIRERAADDIVDIVSSYVKLKRSGSSYKAKCPFHDENTASFSVSPEKGIYKCFGCGEGGDAIDFIMKHEGLEFMQVIRDLAGRYMIDLSERKPTQAEITRRNRRKEIIDSLVPGLLKRKKNIRREDHVTICLDNAPRPNHVSSAWLRLPAPITRGQFQLIKKYTGTILIITLSSKADYLLRTIENGVRQDVSPSFMVDNENLDVFYQGWLKFIMQHNEHTDELLAALKQIISRIDHKISRRIYEQSFIKNLKSNPQG